MKKILMSLIAVMFILGACTTQTAQQPTADVPAVELNNSTEVPSLPEPTAAQTEQVVPETGEAETITLTIVQEESRVTYEVGETFINDNNRFQVAVGVTNTIKGEIYANPNNPTLSQIGTIQINIRDFQSDSSRRDNAIRGQWLESEKYPVATFVPTEISNLPSAYTPGETYTFTVTGDLTVRETTKPVSFEVSSSYTDNVLSGSATTTILMSDFNVGPVSIMGILNTEDEVKITFEFVAKP